MKGSAADFARLEALGARVGPPARIPEPSSERVAEVAGQYATAAGGKLPKAGLDLGTELSSILKLVGIPHKLEYHFAKPRMWRFDIAFPEAMLAVEADGGLHITGGGDHNSPSGFKKDLEKRNRAQLLGWCVLVVTGGMIASGEALKLIEEGLALRKAKK